MAIVGLIALVSWLSNHNADRMYQATASDEVGEVTIPNAEMWTVKPGSVYDGDTLRVVRGNEELKIRFCGIDAPEIEQPLGIESRDHLRSLIDLGGGSVLLVPVETDRYERTVAELYVPLIDYSPIPLNSRMVLDGMAYHYEQYSDTCSRRDAIARAEDIAKSEGLGVWSNPASEKPWEWRRRN